MNTHLESPSFAAPWLDDRIGPEDGLFVETMEVDPEVGEEVVFFLRDQPSTIERFAHLDPLRLMIKPGVIRNLYGLVGYFPFWLTQHDDSDVPDVASVEYFDPCSEEDLSFWHRLAAQSHWRLFFVTGNQILYDYRTYDNKFKLDQGLKQIAEFVAQKRQGDFDRAKALCMEEQSIKDMINRGEGHSVEYLVFSKTDV